MSQPSPVRGESNGSWLPLIEYSVRSGLSLSTIRRKIKSHTLTYRMENGRYLIFFEGANAGLRPLSPTFLASPSGESKKTEWEGEDKSSASLSRAVNERADEETRGMSMMETHRLSQSNVDGTVKMVSEAFECALREKDERIHLLEKSNRSLEERLNELRLLVKVLEEKYEVRY